jgi:hypothetical protein
MRKMTANLSIVLKTSGKDKTNMRVRPKALMIVLATMVFTVATITIARADNAPNPAKCNAKTNPKCKVASPSQ